ncbi:MAG: hypothetical protein NUV92_08415 [Ignavibacteria bacterium]|jgi:hypothetical protein|nr:hypothetical protein [Ignavibacteria bacterium]MDH7527228.1 hypothetical protein [Ignavibacteria bacterium]
MNRKILATIVLIAFILSSCSPTTSLQKITDKYVPTSPEKSRIILEWSLPVDNSPVIKVRIYKDYFSQKVYTKHYETLRNDKKGNQVLLGLVLGGLSAGLFALGSNTSDTSLSSIATIGGLLGGLFSLFLIISDTPKEHYTTDSVDYSDTTYTNRTFIKSNEFFVSSMIDNSSFKVKTDDSGYLKIDIRNFYQTLQDNNDLKLKITDNIASPNYVTIPYGYISKVKQNEMEAEKQLKLAEEKIKSKKFLEASETLNQLTEKYPMTKAAEKANYVLINIQDDINSEKLTIIRKRIQNVSINKVPEALERSGLASYEIQQLINSINSISNRSKEIIIIKGLEMPLTNREALEEFDKLSNPQKIYAIIFASENISKKEQKEKWTVILNLINVNQEIANKLAKILSSRLLN